MSRPVFRFDRAIVREPAPSVVDGISSGGTPPDYARLADEHRSYVAALRAAGVRVEVLAPLPAFPDSIFVEDAAFVLPKGAVLLSPGAPSRTGEAAAIVPAIEQYFGAVERVEAGMIDGGDILVLPDVILVGLSARTDQEGAECFADWARRVGRTVRLVDTPAGSLHFKSGCSLLDEALVLATPDAAAPGLFAGLEVVVTAEGEANAANAIRVNDQLLVSADAPRTAAILERRGFTVVPVATREIEKLDAGLSCMSLRW
ncbi:MAG: arginine deiminase-related protein [Sphingomicrobium sp.]